MKTSRFTYIVALAVGGLLACATFASAQDDSKEGKKGAGRGPSVEAQLDKMKTDLSLTDEQVPKVKAVLEDGAKKRAELRDLAPEERREKMRTAMEEQGKKMKEILTPEQFTKYEKMRDEMRKNRGGPGGGGQGKKEGDKKQ